MPNPQDSTTPIDLNLNKPLDVAEPQVKSLVASAEAFHLRPRKSLRQMLMNPSGTLVESVVDEIERRITMNSLRF